MARPARVSTRARTGALLHFVHGPHGARATRSGSALLLAGTIWLGLTSLALADATVVVQLKRPDGSVADGTVVLSKGDTRLRCTTSQGHCEIKNVPGGSYTVEVEQGAEPAGKPKQVMIPPSGEVKLNVAAK